MKTTIVSVISWVSFFTILIIMCGCALLAGVITVNYLAELLGICGSWWALLLCPVMLIVGWCVSVFWMLGMRKFAQN